MLRLKGQGLPGSDGMPGDAYVEISVRPHPGFKREGYDILSTLAWRPTLARTTSVLASGTGITVAVGDRPLSIKLGRWLCVRRPFVFERLDRKNDCSRAANVVRGAAPRRSCNLAKDFAALATVCDYKCAC